jgi:hypothetical protein
LIILLSGQCAYAAEPEAGQQDIPNQSLCEVDYKEDFETTDPFQDWASNGPYTIHFKGLTHEKASSGQKSFKLDISLPEKSYVYFQIPVEFPTGPGHDLEFAGDIFVQTAEAASVSLGSNVKYLPSGWSGVNQIKLLSGPTQGWVIQTSDLSHIARRKFEGGFQDIYAGSRPEDCGIWTDKIGLFLVSVHGGRVIVYVDNIRLKGRAPSKEDYARTTKAAWEGYEKRIQEEVQNKAGAILAFSKNGLDALGQEYLFKSQSRAKEIMESCLVKHYLGADDYRELKNLYESLDFIGNTSEDIFTIYPWEPTGGTKLLPDTYPVPAKTENRLSVSACPGEFEPASFVIRAHEELNSVKLQASDLHDGKGHTISKSLIELHAVACWYQAGAGQITKTNRRDLVPELLLKDYSLVKVDTGNKKNWLRVSIQGEEHYIDISEPEAYFPREAVVEDATVIQPFSLKPDTNLQIWVTIHILRNTIPGRYTGNILIEAPGKKTFPLTLEVDVLPIHLQKPDLEYAIYYRGKLIDAESPPIGSDWKSIDQYGRELKNIKDHGISNPTLYQPLLDENLLKQALFLRVVTGFSVRRLYTQETNARIQQVGLSTFLDDVDRWEEIAKQYGFEQVYIYGIDEAQGESLLAQKEAWESIRKRGAKIYAACKAEAFDLVGDVLDCPVLHAGYSEKNRVGDFKTEEVEKWHMKGHRVLIYSNPQAGIEDPAIYRRNYGLALWAAGYEGSMCYAYQHAMGHIWNDFDHIRQRDHVFAYPTSTGLINTVEWEGFREAVDDVRYLSTLLAIEGVDREMTKKWVQAELEAGTRPEKIREMIVEEILYLQSGEPYIAE